MNTSSSKWLVRLSLTGALMLLLFLPTTFGYHSPGTVRATWFICAAATGELMMLNIYGLKVLWKDRARERLGLYISTGIAVGVALMLLNIWQEQQQFDFWSHTSIHYFERSP